MLRNRGSCLRVESPLLGCEFRVQWFRKFRCLADYHRSGLFQFSKKLMRRGNHTGPVLDDDLQMRPTTKTYVDLQGGLSETGYEQSLAEQKTSAPV